MRINTLKRSSDPLPITHRLTLEWAISVVVAIIMVMASTAGIAQSRPWTAGPACIDVAHTTRQANRPALLARCTFLCALYLHQLFGRTHWCATHPVHLPYYIKCILNHWHHREHQQ